MSPLKTTLLSCVVNTNNNNCLLHGNVGDVCFQFTLDRGSKHYPILSVSADGALDAGLVDLLFIRSSGCPVTTHLVLLVVVIILLL